MLALWPFWSAPQRSGQRIKVLIKLGVKQQTGAKFFKSSVET